MPWFIGEINLLPVSGAGLLKLGIEFDIQGILQGTVLIKSTPQKAGFFLPGRFSIEEAFRSGLQLEDQSLVDSCLPRYDRRM